MEQFLDQKDGKWHITMWMTVPIVNVKHSYNFRVHSITNNDDSIVRDPAISNSHYVFGLGTKFFSKKVFFNASFDPLEIQDIKSFKFGFCNEQIAWLSNTFLVVENNCPRIINNNDVVVEERTLEVENLDVMKESASAIVETSLNLNESEIIANDEVSTELSLLTSIILDSTIVEEKVDTPIVEIKNEPSIQQKDVVQVAKKKFGRKKK